MIFYNTNGLKTEKPETEFYIIEEATEVYFEGFDIFYDLDGMLVELFYKFQNRIFNGIDYYQNIACRPIWLSHCGIDSDFSFPKDYFARLVKENTDTIANRVLLLHDIFFIISSIQNRLLETKELFTSFYKELCSLNKDVEFPVTEDEGIYWMSGKKTIILYSIIENFIVKLYSIFDLFTKVIIESKNEYNDFSKWPKLVSKEILYGDKGKFYDDSWKDTIFEKTENINLIINFRHEIIHNGSFEYQNKVFFEYKNKVLLEKYIFLLDCSAGFIDTVKNRKRFYSKEKKLNNELPRIYFDLINKIKNTIERLDRNFI